MSPRKLLVVGVVLVAAVLLYLFRGASPEGRNAAPASEATTRTERRHPGSPPLRPVFQRPAASLAPPAQKGPPVQAPNGAFEGRVVSALTGKGLPGAQLTFARSGETSSISAGPEGAFRFDPRAAGRWLLASATADGHLPFAPEWGQSPVLLDARPGEVVRGITIALVPAEEFEGRVVDPQGRPVAEAEITVFGGGAGTATLVSLKDRYRSDSAGAFRFTAPDDAIVEARHEGFATGRGRVDYSVRVGRKLTIRLKPATEASLKIDGVVEDQGGSPTEGAVVSATSKSKPGEAAVTTRSDVEGRFILKDLEAGEWILTASHPGSAFAFLEVAAGATGVRIRLSAGGQLAGKVTNRRSGATVAPFTVLVQAKEMRSLSIIDPSGSYHFDDLAPGPAIVSVVAPGYAPSPEVRVTIPDPGAPPAMADFQLGTGGSLTGLVVERGSAQPIAGARVEVEGTSPSLGVPVRNETVTDPAGRFLLTGLAEDTIGISASAPGHHARIVSAPPIPEGETRGPLTIELTPVKEGEEPRVELTGIGAMLQKEGDVLRITMVAPQGGAAEVGLGPGDSVLSIDGMSVKPMTLTDAVPLLRGPEGSTVTLILIRAGDAQQNAVVIDVPRRLVRG